MKLFNKKNNFLRLVLLVFLCVQTALIVKSQDDQELIHSDNLIRIVGSESKDMEDNDKNLSVSHITVKLAEDEIRFYSQNISKLQNHLKDFAERPPKEKSTEGFYVAIHYAIFAKCKGEVTETEDYSVQFTLKNPKTNKLYYLKFIIKGKDIKRDDIINDFEAKCQPIKKKLTDDIEKLKKKLAGGIEIKKSQKVADAKAKAGQQTPVDELSPAAKDQKQVELNEKIQKKRDLELANKNDTEKLKGSIMKKSDQITCSKQSEEKVKKNNESLLEVQEHIQKIKAEIAELQASQEKYEKPNGMNEDEYNRSTDKTHKDIQQKNISLAYNKKQSNELEDTIADASQEYKKIEAKEDSLKTKAVAIKAESASYKKEKKSNEMESDDLNNKTDMKNLECIKIHNQIKKNEEKLAKIEAELTDATDKRKLLLTSVETLQCQHNKNGKIANVQNIDILSELDKCFDFKFGFINHTQFSFTDNLKDAINYVKSMMPSEEKYNLVDKIYTTSVQDECQSFKARQSRGSLEEPDKKAEKAKKKERSEKRLKRTAHVQIYNSQEIGRRKFMLDHETE